MSNNDVVLGKLEAMEKRLGSIETAVVAIAVQDNKIINIQDQVNAQWRKLDELLAPNEGTISKIRAHQAQCPKEDIKIQFSRVWWAIGLLVTLFITMIATLLNSAPKGTV